MGLRQDYERMLDKKKADIRAIELDLHAAKASAQAYEEFIKRLARDEETSGSQGERVLRSGSSVAKARDAIKKAGKSLRIEDILKAIGKPNDKKNRISLSGSLAHYVRNGQIFTRPEPNTFGLTEFDRDDDDGGPLGEEEDPALSNGKAVGMK